jgi:recombinational DNA repair protein (RecF pathway)
MASFYVYGGQGGGKHHKPSAFDVGMMMKIQIKEKKSLRNDVSELMIVQEHQRIWEPQIIRHQIQAFYLMCLYFEMIQKFALIYHPDQEVVTDDQEGVFSVVSNAIYYLDEAVTKNKFNPEQHFFLFLVKLLFHLGIMPNTESCSFCSEDLGKSHGVSLQIENGQFACAKCNPAENDMGLLWRLRQSYQTRYQDYEILVGTNFSEADKLMKYFCHHFHLRPIELKSYSVLFK